MTIRPISAVLADLEPALAGERVSIGALLETFHERGFGFLLLVLALPAAIPIPGLNTLFAVPMLILAAQQAMGRHTIWMPAAIASKTVPCAGLKKVTGTAMPWLRFLEKFIRPRLGFITAGGFSRLIGVCGMLMAAVASIPFPLTHTVPSAGIALMSIGVIMRDGLAVLVGAVIGLAWIAMLGAAILLLGTEGFDFIRETIHSVF